MSEVWAIIVSVIIAMVIFGYVSSKLSDRKRRVKRENTVPPISDSLKLGVVYDVYLSDGRKFGHVEILGSVENDDDAFSFAGYDGMLVFEQENSKKLYLKKACIRFIVEV